MNELSIIFNRMTSIRWKCSKPREPNGTSSLPPRAGGGPLHRVDPYYLTYKAESIGYHPEMILAGAASMTTWEIYRRAHDQNPDQRRPPSGMPACRHGLTFKENIPICAIRG